MARVGAVAGTGLVTGAGIAATAVVDSLVRVPSAGGSGIANGRSRVVCALDEASIGASTGAASVAGVAAPFDIGLARRDGGRFAAVTDPSMATTFSALAPRAGAGAPWVLPVPLLPLPWAVPFPLPLPSPLPVCASTLGSLSAR